MDYKTLNDTILLKQNDSKLLCQVLETLLLEPRCSIYPSSCGRMSSDGGCQSGVHGNLSSFEVFRGSTEF